MAGRYLNNWSCATSQSNATTAAQIRDEVDQILAATGATKVDLISHSMGGLSTRYYAKNLGGDLEIDDWVSLGGPNHGTPAYGTWWSPCDEVINPDSSVALSGAANTRTACLSHSAPYGDATVFGQVREFVR